MVSENTVKTFSESYMKYAWDIFINLTHWMAKTTILSINGIDFTFLGVLVSAVLFVLVCEILEKIFWGD